MPANETRTAPARPPRDTDPYGAAEWERRGLRIVLYLAFGLAIVGTASSGSLIAPIVAAIALVGLAASVYPVR
jgi:hypothetical protein